MPDSVRSWTMSDDQKPLEVEEAIGLIQSGDATENICVNLGGGVLARANGHLGLQGLLQRLRGHKLIEAMATAKSGDQVVTMRPDLPDMHPQVAEILDALKK